MKKIHLTLLLLAFASGALTQNNRPMNRDTYADEWAEVAGFEQKSLPQSAAKVVDAILRKAIEDKNNPQVIKALIHQGKYDLALDEQNDTAIFGKLNEMLEKSSDAVEQSVLHSILGGLYLQYYQKDRWIIDQRTDLGDFVPDDMKEWTRNIFRKKAIEHLSASIASQNELETAKVESYAAVIELGRDSRRFFPSMYDFLVRRAMEITGQIERDEDLSRLLARKNIPQESLFAPADEFVKLSFDPQPQEYDLWTLEIYRRHLASLFGRGMHNSVLLTELHKLGYLARLQNVYEKYALPSLETLLGKWEGNEMSVEIVDKIAVYYRNEILKIAPQDSVKGAEITKALYDLLKKNIDRYPGYERISVLENQFNLLTQPSFSVSGNRTFPVKGVKRFQVSYKNMDSLTFRLYRIGSPTDVQMAQSGARGNVDSKRSFVKNIAVPLPEIPEYLQGETGFTLDVAEPGVYLLSYGSLQEEGEYNRSDYYFAVSNLAVFARSSDKNKYDFFVVDRVTGEPVKEAKIEIFKLPGNWRNSTLTHVQSIPVDNEGYAVYQKEIPNNDVFYHAVEGDDNSSLLSRLPYRYYDYSDEGEKEQETISLFTDRSLYRPGQTVFYKAILTRTKADESEILPGREVTFTLRDANYRELSEERLKTNEYGSVSGEFVLPRDVLPGDFMIETEQGSVGIRVEEYKRPTFEVTFDKIEKTYKFGEEVTLKGKAESFSGISLQQTAVEYRITRRQIMGWRIWGGTADHFTAGSVTTGDDGGFEITFTPEKPDSEPFTKSVCSFEVEAAVTDINGETQTAVYTVTVGDISMILSLEMPGRWEKESEEKIIVSAKNLDGNDVTADGTYQLVSLSENDSVLQQVAEDTFKTGDQPALKKQLSRLPSGKYRLKLQSKDDRGNPVETEQTFILFSWSDKRPPIETNEWFIVKNSRFSPGKDAEVMLGASEKVHVLYELWQENSLLERKWIALDNENRHFVFPYREQYREGVTLMFTYVKGEKFYALRTDLLPEKEKKELKVELAVFRDKIRPGAEEEWRVTVTSADGNPATAEVLASMYDFSLDNIYPSQTWSLSQFSGKRYFSRMMLSRDNSSYGETVSGNIPVSWKEVTPFMFDRFNWFGYSLLYSGTIMIRGASAGASYAGVKAENAFGTDDTGIDIAELAQNKLVLREKSVTSSLQLASDEAAPAKRDGSEPPATARQPETAQIRRNFNETAFFYPQLRTNAAGETQIAFTVPESNTRWRFRVLAHDKALYTGKTEAFTVSQKELMVTPNLPRFLRQGDRTAFSAKISNLSDSTISGSVKLEFFDPLTDEIIRHITLGNQEQPFSLSQGASSDAWWTFDTPAGADIVGVRIVARSERFSDGEQHALAVLPNRMLVTESMPMNLKGNQTKEFTMEGLLNRSSQTLQDYRLTLEFTSNPAWYAVQALPALGEPESDNAVSWFASCYANLLGAHIGKAYPKVRAMVEAWKKQGGSKETFLSNLEKNRELKGVLLEETPWVLEAKNESEQKERLSLLFDLNRSREITRTAIDKLHDLQTNQGGWSWFKGFSPSVSITQYILYGLHRLKELGAAEFPDELLSMQSDALSFIDAEALRRFDALKKYNKEWEKIKTISIADLEYLYVRSGYGGQPSDREGKEMAAFYRSVIEKNWTQYGLYERALIAVLMAREGKTEVVDAILNSFREHATLSEEMGMYWANNRAQVFMSQSAVSVHTFIMDAFRAGGAGAEEMDEMKQWLLKQKQTQLWETTHATADAVYALLSTGSDWFSAEGKTTVSLGALRVEPESSELGSGYFKESWSRSEIKPEMGRVTVTHQGDTPAWGALYRQYFEETDKIGKTGGALEIEKQLFTEKTTASGTQLVQITEESPLKTGDKVVVRLTVRSDRDLEFVHIKDMRAPAFEPIKQISGMGWQNGVPYYRTSKDASVNFYFDVLPRGTWLFEYAVYVNRPGSYSNGITTIESMYAPEFTSHTAGMRIIVKE